MDARNVSLDPCLSVQSVVKLFSSSGSRGALRNIGGHLSASPMPDSASHAVFLSYAHEDADAVSRLAEALRATGVEVWFDQSELRGGDAWDQNIRAQIRDCALFVPIVSAHTQARREGYFRLEWKLADERTHLMAEGTPFVLPVVVDDTKERDALAPKSFVSVQWTRLPRAEAPSAFAQRVAQLLGESAKASTSRVAIALATRTESRKKSAVPAWAWITGALSVISVVAFFATRKSVPPAAETKPTAPVVSDKSIAVLPFENRSTDKENAFFTDGVQEDILTNLSNLHELRVVSRTSVEQYRGTNKTMKQAGAELGVAYLLEGSVQRAGNKVHVTGQLIDARTDAHLWAKAYDKDLNDIFVIQAELAKAIVAELQAVLTPQEKARLERAPTDNVRAYELYLQARALRDNTSTVLGFATMRRNHDQCIALLEQAVQIDAKFVAAWTFLAGADGFMYFRDFDHVPSRLARAREAIDAAARAAPDDPEVALAQGQFYFYGFRDWPRARAQYERVLAQSPGHLRALSLLVEVCRYEGRWADALAAERKVVSSDPRDWGAVKLLGYNLVIVRRYEEFAALNRRAMEIWPDKFDAAYYRALRPFYANSSKREVEEFFAGLPMNRQTEEDVLRLRIEAAWIVGDAAGYRRWAETLGGTTKLDDLRRTQLGAALRATGDAEGAQKTLREARDSQEKTGVRQPENWGLWMRLAETCAYLGDATAADAAIAKAAALRRRDRDAFEGATTEMQRALVLAWTNRQEAAVRELTRVIRAPCMMNFGYSNNVHHLRDRADFQALLNDPKNNAPLF